MEINILKNKLFSNKNLTSDESLYLFELIMTGALSEIDISAILISLKVKGETKDEILGAAKIMRSKSMKIFSSNNTVDTCGTGGDMSDTLNISTAASLVAASCGIKIAKHGNKSVSSKSGSADMLENIGYKLSDDPKTLESQLEENNFCFMFAQYHHSAMKHVINVRKSLETRTIFNLLGPLTNPANANYQLLGVFDPKWIKIHCEVLKELGSNHSMVVHGQDGLDEISLSAPTKIAELKNGQITEYDFNPVDYGYEYINISDILGKDSEYNALQFINMLNGSHKAFQHIVELNSGAALYVGGKVKNLKEGFELSRYVIENEISKKYLEKIIS